MQDCINGEDCKYSMVFLCQSSSYSQDEFYFHQAPHSSHDVLPLLSTTQKTTTQCHASQFCVPLKALVRLMPHPCASSHTSLISVMEEGEPVDIRGTGILSVPHTW
ncbi:hypothetical protein O3P69_009648 [Scylla paramamosain]|uniref:Uncharacterized protein n=1 Tax=Scylla paramamosain TaxID=85552 RepID=A0AAW0SYM4_SCYPA